MQQNKTTRRDFLKTTTVLSGGAMLSGPIDLIESNPKLRAQLCNVQYQDFLDKPLAVVEQIYATCGRKVSKAGRAAMQKYMDEYPRSSRPPAVYSVGEKEFIARERAYFKHYQEYFGVPNEI